MKLIGGHSRQISSVAFSSDSSLLASSALDGSLAVWRTDTREQLVLFQAPHKSCCSVTFAPTTAPSRQVGAEGDGMAALPAVVAGYGDGTVRVFDVAEGRMVRKVQPHAHSVRAVRHFRDGKLSLSSLSLSLSLSLRLSPSLDLSLSLPLQTT